MLKLHRLLPYKHLRTQFHRKIQLLARVKNRLANSFTGFSHEVNRNATQAVLGSSDSSQVHQRISSLTSEFNTKLSATDAKVELGSVHSIQRIQSEVKMIRLQMDHMHDKLSTKINYLHSQAIIQAIERQNKFFNGVIFTVSGFHCVVYVPLSNITKLIATGAFTVTAVLICI